ncbi:MAG: hypothetical protein IKX85_07195 [Clostridia bacterium]|nr:hypothetical protein [Clostridia bacterium]
MRTLAVYKSKSGASMYYAEEIARALDGEIRYYRSLPREGGYDLVVYCAGVNGGKIDSLARMRSQLAPLGKRFLVAASCLKEPTEEYAREVAEKSGLSPEELTLMRGRMNMARLGVWDRLKLRAVRGRIDRKAEKKKTREDREIFNALSFPTSFTDVRYILPLVKKAREGEEKTE